MSNSSDSFAPQVHILEPDDKTRDLIIQHCDLAGLQTRIHDCADSLIGQLASVATGCMVLAMCMTDISGLDIQDDLHRRNILIPIIFISRYAEVAIVIHAMRNGAFDFFEKPFNPLFFVRRVRSALSASKLYHQRIQQRRSAIERLNRLSPGEREAVDLVIRGFTNKEIAQQLHVTTKAIETRCRRARQKLGVRQALDLARLVVDSEIPLPTFGRTPFHSHGTAVHEQGPTVSANLDSGPAYCLPSRA